MTNPPPRSRRRWFRLLPSAALAACLAGPARGDGPEVAGGADPTVIVDGLSGPLRLAVSPAGQSLYVLRQEAGDVLGVDLENPANRWTAVEARPGLRILAIGAIDTGTLALVARDGDTLSIRVHRLPAPGMPPGESEVQSVPLGVSAGVSDSVRLVVSPARDFIAVAGLPDPLPRVAQTPITGIRLGGITQRRCPRASVRPAAIAIGPNGEWILLAPGSDAETRGTTFLSWFSPSGSQRLLHLETGLVAAVDAAGCRESGLFWAASSAPDRPGLWRVDADYVDGRQRAAAVPVAELPEPTALVCLPQGDVAVAHGSRASRVVRLSGAAIRPEASR